MGELIDHDLVTVRVLGTLAAHPSGTIVSCDKHNILNPLEQTTAAVVPAGTSALNSCWQAEFD